MNKLTDKELIRNYLRGEERALEVLIARYLKPIYFFAYQRTGQDSDVAEDIAQEVFVKMWKNLKKFKQDRTFKAWLFAIAKNVCYDFLRKKKTRPLSDVDVVDVSPGIIDGLREKQTSEALALAVGGLSLKYREVLLWRLRDNFTFQKIAELSGKSINTVKSLYRRATLELRKENRGRPLPY